MRLRCRHTVYAIRPPRPHRSVRFHAALRFRSRAESDNPRCPAGFEAVPTPRRRTRRPRLPPHTLVLVGARCAGAKRYEFQLAKAPDFQEGSLLYSTSLKSPAVTVPMALPWMSGNPYAAYARVRARTGKGITAWTQPFGFNLQWDTVPTASPSQPGLARWTSAAGCHELPRVVHGHRQGRRNEDQALLSMSVSSTRSIKPRCSPAQFTGAFALCARCTARSRRIFPGSRTARGAR